MKFKDFKKVSSSEKSTSFKHKNGSWLHVAHKGLKPEHKKQLDALPCYAEGGDVDENPSAWQKFKNDAYSAADDMGLVNQDIPAAQSGQDFSSQYNVNADGSPASASNAAAQASSGAKFGMNQKTLYGINQYPIPAGQQDVPVADPEQAPDAQDASVPARDPAEVAPPQDAQGAPDADGPAGQEPSPQATAPVQPDQPQQPVSMKDELHNETAAWQQDLANGHIKPETYGDLFAKKSTLGKIGMIFGMLVGGMGSGLTKQPNALLAMMNNEINNDLDAQKQSKSNAQNFLRIHQQQALNDAQVKHLGQEGKLTEAQAGHVGMENNLTAAQTKKALADADIQSLAASRMKMIATAMHEQVLRVNQMPEGPQKEQAKQVLGMMSTATGAEYANIADQAQARSALLGAVTGGSGMNTTALKMVPGMEGVASDIEHKTVPGFGTAIIPAPQETRDRLTALQQYDQKAKEYVNFAQQHQKNWANLNPADRERVANQGAAMGANLQSLYRNKIKGGVYKKGEQEFIQQIIPDNPVSWKSSFNAIPKVQQTISDNSNDLTTTAKSVGLTPPSASKSGRPMVQKNGKWYYK